MVFFSWFRTKRITLEATVTRANGQVEALGVVAFYDVSPAMRFLFWLSNRKGFGFLQRYVNFKIGA